MSLIPIVEYLSIALSMTATTYGFAEYSCGPILKPVPCVKGTVTASGEVFDPKIPTAAIPLPHNRILRAFNIWIKSYTGKCVLIRVNDKKNPRYIGNSGLDLNPAAQELITGKSAKAYWSGKIQLCTPT